MPEPMDITEKYDVLRAGWDRSVDPGHDPLTATTLSPQVKRIRLADDIRLRVEAFGGIVQLKGRSFYFNQAATDLLRALLHSEKIETGRSIGGVPLTEVALSFIGACISAGLIEAVDDERPSRAQIYFADRTREDTGYFRAPTAMEIELTNKCFRHCSYCAYESGPHPKISSTHELSTGEWLHIIDELADNGVLALEFTGGDPFVRDDALEIIKYADSRGFAILINSDLSILNENHLDALTQLRHLFAIQTSLDGASAESCDFTRGKGGFKTLKRQMAILRSVELPFSVGTVVHSKNFDEVGAIAQLVGEAGAAGYYIGPMYPAGRGAQLGDLVVTPDQWDVAVAQFMDAVRSGVVAPADRLWYRLVRESQDGQNPAKDQLYIVDRGDRFLRVDPLGNVYTMAKLRQWHPRFWSLGNLRELPLSAIWEHSRLLSELRSYPMTDNPFGGIDVRRLRAEEEDHQVLRGSGNVIQLRAAGD